MSRNDSTIVLLNPASFGVNEETIIESQKEKKLTEKTIEQREQQRKRELLLTIHLLILIPSLILIITNKRLNISILNIKIIKAN